MKTTLSTPMGRTEAPGERHSVFNAQSVGGKWAIIVERDGEAFTIHELKHGHVTGVCNNYTWSMLHSYLHDRFKWAAHDDGIRYRITHNEISFLP